MIGRYPGDVYAGGNPWQLLTAVLAELFYKGATSFSAPNLELDLVTRKEWAGLFVISENSSNMEFAKAAAQAGDAVLYRLYKYVKDDNGHISEQIAKTTGKQTSAEDLTWSFANVMSALHYRATHLTHLFSA